MDGVWSSAHGCDMAKVIICSGALDVLCGDRPRTALDHGQEGVGVDGE